MTFFEIVDPLIKILNLESLSNLTFESILLRLFLAILCGGILGLERSKKNHAAGFRTYILVCLGSAVAMITNQFIVETTSMGDGARLGAQVISGVGFLGAGTILVTSRNQIKGLTTAAGLWACACMGLAIGVGFYTLALFSSILLIFILSLLPNIERFITSRSLIMDIHIEFQCRENMKEFINYARTIGLKIVSIEHNPAYSSSGLSVYTMVISFDKKLKYNHKYLLTEFEKLEYVNYVEEI